MFPHWIGGAREVSAERIDVVDPASGEVIAAVPAGTTADVERAVNAAQSAFPVWSAVNIDERAKVVNRISEGLATRASEVAMCGTREMGSPIRFSRDVQACRVPELGRGA